MSDSTIIWIIGVVFAAGVLYATVTLTISWNEKKRQESEARLKAQIDGVGAKIRNVESRAERRWKHMIATQIETSVDLDEAKIHAKLLREDAWRD